MTEKLGKALLNAHSRGDGALIAKAYLDAADAAEAEGDRDRAGFFLTHAWVFALEAADPLADLCHARLVQDGRV